VGPELGSRGLLLFAHWLYQRAEVQRCVDWPFSSVPRCSRAPQQLSAPRADACAPRKAAAALQRSLAAGERGPRRAAFFAALPRRCEDRRRPAQAPPVKTAQRKK